MPIQLLDLYSPISAKEVDDALYVSGFASMQKVDREGEIVDPMEFDLATFMNCPQLLVNHEYVKGEDGASRAVGSVEKAVPSYISGENPSNPDEWVVKSLLDNDFVSLWAKKKCPHAVEGDKGLFVVAKVTHKPTIRQILDKEIGGFSWVGYSLQETDIRGIKHLKAIDLIEISVVNGPAMSQSTLEIADEDHPLLSKDIDFTDYEIYKVGFSKSAYQLDDVRRYTKRLRLGKTLSENEGSYFIDIGDGSQVDAEKSLLIKMADRCLIAAPKIKKKTSCVSKLDNFNSTVIEECIMENSNTLETEAVQVDKSQEIQKLYVLDIDSFLSLNPNASILKQKSTAIGDVPVEIHSIELPVEDFATEETTSEEDTEVVAEAATEEITEEVVAEQTEEVVAEETTEETTVEETVSEGTQVTQNVDLSRVEETLQILAQLQEQTIARQQELEAKMNEMQDFSAVKEELKGEIKKALEVFESGQKKNEEQRRSISKQLQAFNSIVPETSHRSEKVESAKSVSSDSISIFDYFGQVKEKK